MTNKPGRPTTVGKIKTATRQRTGNTIRYMHLSSAVFAVLERNEATTDEVVRRVRVVDEDTRERVKPEKRAVTSALAHLRREGYIKSSRTESGKWNHKAV